MNQNWYNVLYPLFPYLGCVAHCCFAAISDYGGFVQERVIEEFFLHIMGDIFQVAFGVFFAVFVDEVFDPYNGLNAVQFASAETLFCKIDKLKGDAPIFEISLCLACFRALEGTEDLNTHYLTSGVNSR